MEQHTGKSFHHRGTLALPPAQQLQVTAGRSLTSESMRQGYDKAGSQDFCSTHIASGATSSRLQQHCNSSIRTDASPILRASPAAASFTIARRS
jgi:hypothetical protein